MEIPEIQAIFVRHMDEFQREIGALNASPEMMEKIRKAVDSAFPDEQRAVGFAARLAEHWEAFAPTLLAMANSEKKKQELLDAMTKMIYEQVREFTRILTSDLRG